MSRRRGEVARLPPPPAAAPTPSPPSAVEASSARRQCAAGAESIQHCLNFKQWGMAICSGEQTDEIPSDWEGLSSSRVRFPLLSENGLEFVNGGYLVYRRQHFAGPPNTLPA